MTNEKHISKKVQNGFYRLSVFIANYYFRPIVVVFKTMKDRDLIFESSHLLKRNGKYSITQCDSIMCIF